MDLYFLIAEKNHHKNNITKSELFQFKLSSILETFISTLSPELTTNLLKIIMRIDLNQILESNIKETYTI